MKNGLFIISDNTFSDESSKVIGVHKKIKSQIFALKTLTDGCELVNLINKSKKNILFRKFETLFSSKIYDSYIYKDCHYLYIRRIIPVTFSFLSYLKKMKTLNKNIMIFYEIPTFPYDFEMKGSIKQLLFLVIDKLNRKQLKKYINYIVTFTNDKKIFKINTINIVNGIDFSTIPISNRKKEIKEIKEINLIAVAQFSFWHGYDRLLEGLSNYYSKSRNLTVKLFMVGEGPELSKYQNYVSKNNLNNYVVFTGELSGYELDSIFEMSDIAVNALGCHRKKIFLSSELKSREYMARGLPLIGSTKIDMLSEEWKYIKYFPEDDSFIDIEKIISFYDGLCKGESIVSIRNNIRTYAENKCDMKNVMKKVVQYI